MYHIHLSDTTGLMFVWVLILSVVSSTAFPGWPSSGLKGLTVSVLLGKRGAVHISHRWILNKRWGKRTIGSLKHYSWEINQVCPTWDTRSEYAHWRKVVCAGVLCAWLRGGPLPAIGHAILSVKPDLVQLGWFCRGWVQMPFPKMDLSIQCFREPGLRKVTYWFLINEENDLTLTLERIL